MKKFFLLSAVAVLSAFTAHSQCTTGGSFFGSAPAPCSADGAVSADIAGFEVWRGDLYEVADVQAGASYSVDICQLADGVGGLIPTGGGAAWTASLTVVAPSGSVVAFGLDAGSICERSFVATESGLYQMFVNEVGECPGISQDVDNGTPRVTYFSGADCAPPITLCEAGTGDYSLTAASVCPGEATELTVTGMSIPNSPTAGGAAVQFSPGVGGTGGLEGVFVITGYTIADFAPYVFDSDVNGILSFNGLPPLAGNWDLQAYVYPNAVDVFTKCDSVVPSASVDFLTAGSPGCVAVTACEAGTLDQAGIDNELCPQETTDYNITGFTLPNSPVAGEYVLEFTPVLGSGAGGPFGGEVDPSFFLTLGAAAGSENADVTVVLDNELFNSTGAVQPAMTGEWSIRGAVYSDDIFPCDSVPAVVINFKTDSEFPCGGPAPCTSPYPAVDAASLSLVENGNGSITFSWDAIPGQIGCQVNVLVAGGPQQASVIVAGGSASSFTAPANALTPFTTYDFRVRCGCQQNPTLIAGPFTEYVNIFYGLGASAIVSPELSTARKIHFGQTGGVQIASSVSNIFPTEVDATTSVKGVISKRATKTSTSFDVFPNPSSGAVNLKYEAGVKGLVNVRVFDMVGKAVADFNMTVNEGANFLNLDLSSLDKGIYVIEVLEGQMSSTSKVVMK